MFLNFKVQQPTIVSRKQLEFIEIELRPNPLGTSKTVSSAVQKVLAPYSKFRVTLWPKIRDPTLFVY